MATKSLPSTRFQFMVLACVATLLSACTGTSHNEIDVREYQDSRTGVTITAAKRAIVLYSEEPLLTANTRDYVSMGPVEVNQSGNRSYLLWIGIWTTIDRPDVSEDTVRKRFDPIYFLIDGEPMEFNRVSRSDIVEAPYEPPAPGAIEGYYAITRDQIIRFANAADLKVQAPVSGISSKDFHLWRMDIDPFTQFAEFLQLSDK